MKPYLISDPPWLVVIRRDPRRDGFPGVVWDISGVDRGAGAMPGPDAGAVRETTVGLRIETPHIVKVFPNADACWSACYEQLDGSLHSRDFDSLADYLHSKSASEVDGGIGPRCHQSGRTPTSGHNLMAYGNEQTTQLRARKPV
jgi:hypothetical protein